MVHATEIDLLMKIDITVLTQPTIYDCVREMGDIACGVQAEKEKLWSYLDNYMCYVLVSMGLEVNIVLHCITAILFFYAANQGRSAIEFMISIIRTKFAKKAAFFQTFDQVVSELVQNLKTLGNDPQVLESMARDFEAKNLFE